MRARASRRSGGSGVLGGKDVLADADLHGAVAAAGAEELPDRPVGAAFDEARDGQSCEDDGQVGLDGVALAVVDRRGTLPGTAESGSRIAIHKTISHRRCLPAPFRWF